ncbi:class I adenylate-forming enzyme family protein [Rhodococcus sp. NPDC127528]|uniref:class I adenylate-forming enzyme family protein n=1 Tax=unclassified Rhodococcus (in: high G+C Gram-positive bacteria) TaxID=192944 RepID=UPI00362A5912
MQPDLTGIAPLDVNLATRAAVGDALTRSAQMFGARTAITDGDRAISYRDLDATSSALANALLGTGLDRQQPVAMLMRNSSEFVATYFACAKSALVALPVNIALSPDDIAWILRDAGVSTIVADRVALPLLTPFLAGEHPDLTIVVVGDATDAPAGSCSWDEFVSRGSVDRPEVIVEDRDTVQCLYTSGTTSRPKGVLVSHVSVLIAGMTNALQIGHSWGADPSTLVNVLPLFHTTALNTLVLPVLFTGGTVVLHAQFDPVAIIADIEKHSATHLMMLPIMYRALVAARGEAGGLPTVRRAVYAMAPMPGELLDRVDDLFPNAAVILGSGQTEVVPATVLQWSEHRHTKPDSWGPATATVETGIMDPAGKLVQEGASGEIVYRGPHVASGYWNNPEANRVSFAHGWFHSGDIGHLDDERVVWFTDRLKDIIKSGGENVSSVDVERVVTGAPGVAECSIVGMPDERWGEAVCAVVVPVDAEAVDDEFEARIIAHAKAHLAGFQVPKRVVVVDALPKTATGKTRKNELRTQFAD